MKSVVLILPYFGKWPVWFEAHLLSISHNPTIDWLLITDCDIPEFYPKNIRFISTSLSELNVKVNAIVEAQVPLSPRKFCDLKPAYGAIFEEYISEYDFWGFCDMDIIWGAIRTFITPDILEKYDIISSRKDAISGHFNLFRNTEFYRTLYKQVPHYKTLFELPKFQWFDEHVLTSFLQNNPTLCRVYWDDILLNQERGRDSHQDYYLDRWLWKSGQMLDTHTQDEVLYLHFINWKRTLTSSEVVYTKAPESFYISYSGIHHTQHHPFDFVWNGLYRFFNGYYRREWRRLFLKKIASYSKRIRKKLNLSL